MFEHPTLSSEQQDYVFNSEFVAAAAGKLRKKIELPFDSRNNFETNSSLTIFEK